MDRSSVPGILQERTLEWLAIPFPGYLPDPGIKPGSAALEADSLPSGLPGKPILIRAHHLNDLIFILLVNKVTFWGTGDQDASVSLQGGHSLTQNNMCDFMASSHDINL